MIEPSRLKKLRKNPHPWNWHPIRGKNYAEILKGLDKVLDGGKNRKSLDNAKS